VPVSMMVPLKVSRSTIAAHRRGSVKDLVQPENDSFDAIAREFASSRSVRTWKRSPGRRRSSWTSQARTRSLSSSRNNDRHRGKPVASEPARRWEHCR
jgi:hypothetical protein